MRLPYQPLPGITFQTGEPELPNTLPRMDIAAFVGFAARGPINTPTLVEDVAQFRDIFGSDVTLPWCDAMGQTARSYLAVSIELFFTNGGQHCYVVRVPHNTGASFRELLLGNLRADSTKALFDALQHRLFTLDTEPLRGIYSLFAYKDVVLIAVPDAVHAVQATVKNEREPKSADWSSANSSSSQQTQPPVELTTTFTPCESDDSNEDNTESSATIEGMAESQEPVETDAVEKQHKSGQEPSGQIILQTIHLALLRMCAARGDTFALLSLPRHFHVSDCATYAQQLQDAISEARPLAFGALYHAWVYTSVAGQAGQNILRFVPPDGAVCGQFAAQALTHGVWRAPANHPLRRVFAVRPLFTRSDWELLYAKQVNLIRQDPRGFIVLSANTLSQNVDFRPIHTRRLLNLLRRIAVREGNKYTFAVQSPQFERLLRHKFELLLGDLFRRGAFAGRTSDQAFRVMVTSSANRTQNRTEQGRLMIDLYVAPAQPLVFVNIRLIQQGQTPFVIEGA